MCLIVKLIGAVPTNIKLENVTVMKTTFQKLNPEIIHYRDHRKYNNHCFRQDILYTFVMENMNFSNGLQKFMDICMKSLDKFAPRKKGNIQEVTTHHL